MEALGSSSKQIQSMSESFDFFALELAPLWWEGRCWIMARLGCGMEGLGLRAISVDCKLFNLL